MAKSVDPDEMAVDPDETAPYELPHLDLHCLHGHWFWIAGLKALNI